MAVAGASEPDLILQADSFSRVQNCVRAASPVSTPPIVLSYTDVGLNFATHGRVMVSALYFVIAGAVGSYLLLTRRRRARVRPGPRFPKALFK